MNELSHDQYIKALFSNKENVKTFLEYCLPDIAKHINIHDIESQPTEKILPDYGETIYLDFAVHCSIKDIESKIYILFEHKSYPDKNVITQIMKYILGIWTEDIKNNKDFTFIIPVVIYNGTSNWNIPTDTKESFKHIPEELRNYIFSLKYILFDVNTLDNQRIKDIFLVNQYLGLGLQVMKRIIKWSTKRDNLVELLRLIDDLLKSYSINEGIMPQDIVIRIKEIILYIQYEYKASPNDIKELLVKEVPSMKSAIDLFIEEGIEKGVEKGIEKGKLEAKKEAVIKLYTKKSFDITEIANMLDLTVEFVEDTLKEARLLKS